MMIADKWWKIQAYNSTPYWGFGSQNEAGKFAEICDMGRDVNLHMITEVTDLELITRLEAGGEGFNLADALLAND